jgi:type IVB pilus formation R64 PilN family outer membrane protein
MMRSFSVLLLFPLLLTACATSELDPLIESRTSDVEGIIETAREPGAAGRSTDALVVSDSLWAGDRAFRMTSGEPLPAEWLRADSIAIRSDTPLELTQIASILSAQTKIPIRLTGGAEDVDSDLRQGASTTPTGGGPINSPASSSGTSASGMILAYEGPLSGLLDLVSGYYNVSWQYANGTITINRFQTRTFVIDALPGSITVAAPGGSGASSGAAASATATPLSSANIDIWSDIDRTLQSIIGDQGSVTISQSSGTIVVSTTSDRMEQVSRYIEDENVRLSRQVAITIDLYTVDISDSSAYGFDLRAAISSIADLPTVSLSGPSTGLTSPGSVTVTLVEPNELTGTRGIAQALAVLGKTTRIAQIPITTLNNRPASQRIAVDTAYVSEVSTTTTGTAGTTTSAASTETVTTGITVSILPRVMSDGRILLQYALAQGELLGLENFEVGDGQTVQLPETQGISFSQQVMMRNAATLVLAGYDQSDASRNARGVGRPLTWILGGSTQSQQARKMVVIAITPREISVARREAS